MTRHDDSDPWDNKPLAVTDEGIQYVEFDGYKRALACHEPHLIAGMPSFSEVNDIIPASQWQPMDGRHYNVSTFDQKDSNSCVGQCIAQAVRYTLKKTRGKDVLLNPYFVYALINNGVDRGALILKGIEAAIKVGVCDTSALPEQLMFKNSIGIDAYLNAKSYRLTDGYACESYEELCTALSKGFFAVVSLYVDQHFGELDANNVCQLPKNSGGRHAVLLTGLDEKPKYGWCPQVHNSWGPNFGDNGFGYIHQGFFDKRLDAYAVQTAADEEDSDIPVAREQ